MRIVIDRNIPGVDKTFAQHGDIERVDGRSLDRQQLLNADVLITRSISRVDAGLLKGTPVRFVGTATIGTDHLDTSWLEQQGITWASAPGWANHPSPRLITTVKFSTLISIRSKTR